LSSRDVIHAAFRHPDSSNAAAISHSAANKMETVPSSGKNADSPAVEFARCFLRLANLPNFALDRLSRYEASLLRQAPDARRARKPGPPQTAGAGAHGGFGWDLLLVFLLPPRTELFDLSKRSR